MQTVLILDGQSAESVHRQLDSLDCLVLAVNDVPKARYLLLNYSIDVWVCDLAASDLDFRSLRSEGLSHNPHVRILLTGEALSQRHASTLIKENLAARFVAKPWQALNIKQAIVQLLSQAPPPARDVPAKPAGGRPLVAARRRLRRRRIQGGARNYELPAGETRYRLDELLGEGGTGRVYRAFDLLLEMEVAVKLLNVEMAGDETAIQSIKDEARICLKLQHKHIVRLFNLEKRRDLYLIIMEYVRGCTLYQLMSQSETLPPLMVLQIVTVLVDALSYAHKHGILHKDLTPGNILISNDGLLKVIDFGIADVINRQQRNDDYVVGTPSYMSPEQLRGETLDVRSDVYSLGVLTYQCLTGRLPSPQETSIEDLAQCEHPPLAGLPYPVLQVLELATAFDPTRRWPSVFRFGTAFAAACAQEFDVHLDND